MTELEQILELSGRIEQLVAAASWSEAATLEGERRSLLAQFIAAHPERSGELRQIQQGTERTLRLAREQRGGLVEESGAYLNRMRAMRAYLERTGRGVKPVDK